MSGPPPPLGESWFPNVGGNIAMNREPVPPSFDPPQPPPMPEAAPEANGEEQRNFPTQQHYLPGVALAHSFGPFLPPMGLGMSMPMPFGPFGLGGMGMGMGMGHIQSAGPLAPPRLPWNTPGLLGNPSTQYGANVPGMPWVGYPQNLDGPPAPPNLGGCVPPFAPGVPLWCGGTIPGLGMMSIGGGLGLGGTGMLGMNLGMGMGFWPGMHRPAPGVITEAVAPEQPKQGDITNLPGGVPPGATFVESTQHTIVNVLKGPHFPWLNHGMPMEVEILYMSSSTGINRLIEVCNNNQDCEGYGISEVHEMVNGQWEKGQTFLYGDPMSVVLTLGDAGWNNERNRPGGRSLHVYFHKV